MLTLSPHAAASGDDRGRWMPLGLLQGAAASLAPSPDDAFAVRAVLLGG